MALCSARGEVLQPAGVARLCGPIVATLLVLAGCAPPPPPPPTVVNVRASAAADANATPDGKGAPVAIRVYQLASKAGFEGAALTIVPQACAPNVAP